MANVVIKNRLPQLVKVAIIGEAEEKVEIKLLGYASTAPIDEAKLTAYTRGLVAKGFLQLLPV